eukprot:398142-Rhodomonas_salina.2
MCKRVSVCPCVRASVSSKILTTGVRSWRLSTIVLCAKCECVIARMHILSGNAIREPNTSERRRAPYLAI